MIKRFIANPQFPVWIGLILAAGALYYTTIGTNLSIDQAFTQLQQPLQKRYINYRPELDSLQIQHYPTSIRSYTKKQRKQIQRYWTEIVLDEYLTIQRFDRATHRNNWSIPYGMWVESVLKYQVLGEEYCAIKKYLDVPADFIKRIDIDYAVVNGRPLNCDKLLEQRMRNTTE